jgi:kynurenine formamidase
MARRIVDLSMPIENDVPSDPPGLEPRIRYIDHQSSFEDLDWCFQPAVKLDFRHLPDGHVVQPADVEAELARIGHVLQPLEIVVVHTRASEAYGSRDYLRAGCGMGFEATPR